MSEISRRISALSPEKRELLLRRLRAQNAPQREEEAVLADLEPDPSSRLEPAPLTEIQQVYLAGRSGYFELSCGSNAYLEYEIRGDAELFLQAVHVALPLLVERHDILRTVFLPDGRQRILPDVPPYRVELIDLRGRRPEEAELEVEATRERLRYLSGQVEEWPLFEFLVHRLTDERSLLHVRLDALLIDGMSRQVLTGDLFRLFGGDSSVLPELAVSYRDYAVARHALRGHSRYQRARAYWLEKLPSLPPCPELPLAKPLGEVARCRFQYSNVALLSSEEWSRIKQRGAQEGLTPSLIVLTAYADVVFNWSRRFPFTLSLVGTEHLPSHPQIHDTIGNYNTVSLLAVEDLTGTFVERAVRLRSRLAEDMEHRYFSGFEVLRELKRLRGGHASAAMPVFLNSVIEYSHPSYQRGSGAVPSGTSEAVPPTPFGVMEVETNLYAPQTLLVPTIFEPANGTLRCKWQSLEDVFRAGVVEEMLEAFQGHLKRLAEAESWSEPVPELLSETQRACLFETATQGCSLPSRAADAAGPNPRRPPRSGVERRLAGIWEQVLEQSPVGVGEDFFELGGNSFLLIVLMTRLEEEFGRSMPISDFFREPTVARVAAALDLEVKTLT